MIGHSLENADKELLDIKIAKISDHHVEVLAYLRSVASVLKGCAMFRWTLPRHEPNAPLPGCSLRSTPIYKLTANCDRLPAQF